ncbi:acyl-CoA dehydrogenase family protein [Leucobacter chromiireducens]|uniref:acyl-CoA dehydrogenase family protein n=1 Tax=Leucobacter chromiireducens TaxID=283877 RepID=UPI000F63E410|nr:acyl-CoA dehydrogenase family protein [Leucobacter chromiireducens]
MTSPSPAPRLIDAIKPYEQLILNAEVTIEDERRVPDEVTDALYESGMYRAFMPRELGGLEVHPNEWLEAVEEVSRLNGSVGWLCMLHTGATWATPEAMHEILKTERWITAGNVGRASGIARKVEGGYMIQGKWPFCSGSPEASYLYGRAVLHSEDGEPLTSPRDGLPYYISGYVPAAHVQVHNNWNGLGLRGTGSGDITIDEVFVPSAMVNETGIWTHHYDSPLMRANFNLAAHAAHALGLAVAAVEEFTKTTLMRARRGSFRQARLGKEQSNYIAVGKADAKLRAARLFMRDVIEQAFADAQTKTHIDYELRVLMHEVNVHVVAEARQVVEMMFKEIGAVGTVKGLRMERIFRDMMTASQHAIVIESSYDRAGQYWLTKDLESGPLLDVEFGYVRPPHPQNQHRSQATAAVGADTQ